jgi:hypothetical protein
MAALALMEMEGFDSAACDGTFATRAESPPAHNRRQLRQCCVHRKS